MTKQSVLHTNYRWVLFVLGLLALIIWAFATAPIQAGAPLSLSEPGFLGELRTADDQAAVDAIADEAGIAAYFNAGSPINLTNARTVFRTIEAETATYIIGSVGVTDYDENHDVHVYVDSSGWIMAYHDDSVPTSKIFDWRLYDGGTEVPTTLDTVLGIVASTSGVSVQSPAYYHFSYPNATHLLLIAETQNGTGTDSFTVNLPPSQNYFERSWSLAENEGSSYQTKFSLNGTEIKAHRIIGWSFSEGLLTASQLGINSDHELSVYNDFHAAGELGFLGLALVYEVP